MPIASRKRLWSVTTPSGKVNYVLGTMHIPEWNALFTHELQQIIHGCRHFYFEAHARKTAHYDPDREDTDHIIKFLQTPDAGLNLRTIDPKPERLIELFATAIRRTFQRVGRPITDLPNDWQQRITRIDIGYLAAMTRIEAFAVMDSLMVTIFDDQLYRYIASLYSNDLKITIDRLENLDTTKDYYLEQDPFHKRDAYHSAINNFRSYMLYMQTSIRGYMIRSLGSLLKYYDQLPREILMHEYYRVYTMNLDLLTDGDWDIRCGYRTAQMNAKIMEKFEQGECLVAVGIAHLFDFNGIIQTLADKGYRVEPVYETPNTGAFNCYLYGHKQHFVTMAGYYAMKSCGHITNTAPYSLGIHVLQSLFYNKFFDNRNISLTPNEIAKLLLCRLVPALIGWLLLRSTQVTQQSDYIYATAAMSLLAFSFDLTNLYRKSKHQQQAYIANTPPGFTPQWVQQNEKKYYGSPRTHAPRCSLR